MLTLDDINWRAGVITIYGKGRRDDQLPLPVDVGVAGRLSASWSADQCGGPCGIRANARAAPGDGIGRGQSGGARRQPSGPDSAGPRAPITAHRRYRAVALRRDLAEVGQVLRHRSAAEHRDLRQGR